MNTESHEMVYVSEGKGRVIVDGIEQTLTVGDIVSISPKKRFYWDGTMKLVMSCQPAFRAEQYVLEQDA
jgi:quercetin dioxygenase-like cupin family protein